MDRVNEIQIKARDLARSGEFCGWLPIKFELRFEDGMQKREHGLTTQRLMKNLIAFVRGRGCDAASPVQKVEKYGPKT